MSDDARRLGDSVDSFLKSQGLSEMRDLAAVVAHWSEIVGKDVASHVTPTALRKGELIVSVDHATWATELSFLTDRILERLSEQVGNGVVTAVKARVRSTRRLD